MLRSSPGPLGPDKMKARWESSLRGLPSPLDPRPPCLQLRHGSLCVRLT